MAIPQRFHDGSSRAVRTTIKGVLTFIFLVQCLHAGNALARDILVLGDSISAAYGIDVEDGWVALLQRELANEHRVINASVSGETTSGGRGRLPKLLETHQPDLVIIELGGNDGLRGYPIQTITSNLDAMVQASLDSGAEVLILGIRIPPNYGDRYTEAFFASFQQVADKHAVPLVPFFLDGVATVNALMQNDGIHPNRQGQAVLLANMLPALEEIL